MRYTFVLDAVRYSRLSDRGQAVLSADRADKWRQFKQLVTLWTMLAAVVLPTITSITA